MIDSRDNRMAFRRALGNGPLRTDKLAEALKVTPAVLHARARTLLKNGDVKKDGYVSVGKKRYRSQVNWVWVGQ